MNYIVHFYTFHRGKKFEFSLSTFLQNYAYICKEIRIKQYNLGNITSLAGWNPALAVPGEPVTKEPVPWVPTLVSGRSF